MLSDLTLHLLILRFLTLLTIAAVQGGVVAGTAVLLGDAGPKYDGRSVDDCQIFRGELSVSAGHEFVLDLLAFVEALQSRALNGGDVDKHIVAALDGYDEPETFARIEPLHDPGRHDHSLPLEYSQRQGHWESFRRAWKGSANGGC